MMVCFRSRRKWGVRRGESAWVREGEGLRARQRAKKGAISLTPTRRHLVAQAAVLARRGRRALALVQPNVHYGVPSGAPTPIAKRNRFLYHYDRQGIHKLLCIGAVVVESGKARWSRRGGRGRGEGRKWLLKR